MNIPGFGPTYAYCTEPDGAVIVRVTPGALAGPLPPRYVQLTADQFERFLRWRRGEGLIQNVLPELTDSDREGLMTGLGDEVFDRMADEGNCND